MKKQRFSRKAFIEYYALKNGLAISYVRDKLKGNSSISNPIYRRYLLKKSWLQRSMYRKK